MPYKNMHKQLRYFRDYYWKNKSFILKRKMNEYLRKCRQYRKDVKLGTAKTCSKCLTLKSAENFHIGHNVCKSCHYARTVAWNIKNKRRLKQVTRRSHLKRKFGITLDDEKSVLLLQDNKCAICGLRKRLGLDHCHKTGRLRQYLCRGCNSGLGQFADSISLLKRATRYLIYHK